MNPAVRMFALCGAFAAGVLVAEALNPGMRGSAVAGVLTVALLASASMFRRDGARAFAVIAAACCLGASLTGWRLSALDRSALGAGGATGADATITGEVLARPSVVGGTLRFTFGASRATIDGRDVIVRERVSVSVRPAPPRAPAPGDRLVIEGRLAPASASKDADPTLRAAARRLRYSGVAARAFVRPDAIAPAGRSSNPIVVVARAGQRAVGRAASAMPPREAGLFRGVVVGDKDGLDPDVEADFRATGLSHLLAVSGENLAMFLAVVGAILGAFRAGRRLRIAVLAIATIAFMAITRFEPSVLRAGAMAAVGIVALAAGARRHTMHALAVAALGLLVWDPFLIHSPGFQLSALATVGLLVIAPRLRDALPRGRLAAAAAVTLGAQLAVAPLVALQFHETSLVALPANVLAVPAVAPATVLGFTASTLGVAWAPAARACALLARPFLSWTALVARSFARIPHASIATPSGAGAILAVGAALAMVAAALRVRRIRVAQLLLAVMLIVTGSMWAGALAPAPPGGLRVTALDVGQGEAILVQAPGGATMLVDGGPDPRVLLKRLRDRGVKRIDLLVLTHPHADHVNGLADAALRYPIGREIDPGEPDAPDMAPGYRRYLAALASKRVPRQAVRAGARFALGPATIDVLWPAHFFSGTNSDLNNDSVVMRLSYGRSSVLLAGEVQEEAQEELLAHPDRLRASVFKVPHHGSQRGLREFFAASGSGVALISVGPNDYGQPAIQTMHWLAELRMRTYRTDRYGDVTVALSPRGAVSVVETR